MSLRTKKLIAANWKMNGDIAFARNLAVEIAQGEETGGNAQLLLCPPFPYLSLVKQAIAEAVGGKPSIALGAQDCSSEEHGAFTGDVSAAMLADLGVSFVILGHSERRYYHGESNEIVRLKAEQAHKEGLITIICVGESEEERDAGQQESVVATQLMESLPHDVTTMNTVIAYEPIWAIGTGKTASSSDVEAMHNFIRKNLKGLKADYENLRILYGGSMKPENAAELLATPNVDGGLIGGASLKAESFLAIAKSAKSN